MKLAFPNISRTYNPTKRCVRFGGYDSVFEVSFDLDEDALYRMAPQADQSEESLLAVFDLNRMQIERAANAAYSRRRQKSHWLPASAFAFRPADG